MAKPTIISIGHRCSCAGLLKDIGYKEESYPFDWLVSKLDVVQQCIENNFVEFMKKENYKIITCNTINNIDGNINHLKQEGVFVNSFYQPEKTAASSTFHLRLGINHFDMLSEIGQGYYERCIQRFKTKMNGPDKKILLYFHPIIGPNSFKDDYDSIRDLIVNFFDFIQGTYVNSYGLFFVLVKGQKTELTTLYKLSDITIYKLETNDALVDTGYIWHGTCEDEIKLVSNIIKQRYNHPDGY